MKAMRYIAVLALGIGFSQLVLAQAPASAPTGSTGMCKDGTFTTAASKSGACRGHKGIQTWYSADSAKPKAAKASAASSAATPAPAAATTSPAAGAAASNGASAPAKTSPAASSASLPAAPGGGPGMVWVNTATNVYHCTGTRFYGKTKAGKYMTEAQAKAAGAHADHGKGCGQ